MNEKKTELPGFWRLAWMLFMQPVSLHYRLKACGINPDASAWTLWRTAGLDQAIRRAYVRRMFAILLILMSVGTAVVVKVVVAST